MSKLVGTLNFNGEDVKTVEADLSGRKLSEVVLEFKQECYLTIKDFMGKHNMQKEDGAFLIKKLN